jgi:two-component system, cell cycle response regulator
VITSEPDAETLLSAAKNALSERGDRFAVGCSLGSTQILAGITLEEALRVADQRLYTDKRSSRRHDDGQAHDVLLSVLAERSDMLATHVSNVGRLAAAVAHQLSLTDDEVALVRLTAELHDIGKTAIPDAILNKPGPLDDNEWAFIRRHTMIGERILAAAPALDRIATLVRATHERFDGTGYPDRLNQDEIPLTARIVAVVDAYDAMTSTRPYRATLTPDEAIAELRRCAGTQFDPTVTDAFITVCRQLADQVTATMPADNHAPLAA